MKVYNRADIVNFMKVDDAYIRMQGFTEGGKSLNSKTYSRQYIDEDFEREDVVGYSPEIAYAFDRIIDNQVHDKIVDIHDNELKGESVEILTVNFNEGDASAGYSAKSRMYSVIPDAEGDGTDAYAYSGKFRASGKPTEKKANVSEDGLTATLVV